MTRDRRRHPAVRRVTSAKDSSGNVTSANRGAEAGSATVWVLVASALVGAAGLIGVLLTSAVLTRHRAETAADLAALAAADGVLQGRAVACRRAARVAAADSATLVSCRLAAATAEVVVSVPARGVLAKLPPVRARSRAGPAGVAAVGRSAARSPPPR